MRVDQKMACFVCYCIAKLVIDPSGLFLVATELVMSDEQLSHLLAVPLPQGSRAERMRAWEGCFAVTSEACSEEVMVVQQHLRSEEVLPLARILRSSRPLCSGQVSHDHTSDDGGIDRKISPTAWDGDEGSIGIAIEHNAGGGGGRYHGHDQHISRV
jgi:hypothetical protein